MVKIDIEGGEWDIILQWTKKDLDKIGQISVEFYDFIDNSLKFRTEECIMKLLNYGYNLIHHGSNYMYGTSYMDCIFFKN